MCKYVRRQVLIAVPPMNDLFGGRWGDIGENLLDFNGKLFE